MCPKPRKKASLLKPSTGKAGYCQAVGQWPAKMGSNWASFKLPALFRNSHVGWIADQSAVLPGLPPGLLVERLAAG
ncbi:MAG: hypothetical protein A3A80_00615 [Candidatus Terrybacteria bacterium RIFCSPLOWO2_01_FULL_44_24]|nr:MAG: hypothetical protein A3B75_02325 [Candidatus Terrybacteria bacterium RIFCSPHIGHO2_02_FULL_43_14]OHA51429.1 MAG: hypothetical protein A3A80_00615 [Candidatus Terrybacteria bacterium RIFCSPLOWO2_01_FULL_44_24]